MTVIKTATAKLNPLRAISDDTGVLQFTFFGVPDLKSGYTTDDNAWALIVAAMHYTLTVDEDSLELANRYLTFLRYVQRDDGWFHNLAGYDRCFPDEIGSEDCFEQSLWALGKVLNSDLPKPMHKATLAMWERSSPNARKLQHPRPKAYLLVGVNEAAKGLGENCPSLIILVRQLLDDLHSLYIEHSNRNWRFADFSPHGASSCLGLFKKLFVINCRANDPAHQPKAGGYKDKAG